MDGLNYLSEVRNNKSLCEELYFEAIEVVNKLKNGIQLNYEDEEIIKKVKETSSNGLNTYFSLTEALHIFSISKLGEIKSQVVKIN